MIASQSGFIIQYNYVSQNVFFLHHNHTLLLHTFVSNKKKGNYNKTYGLSCYCINIIVHVLLHTSVNSALHYWRLTLPSSAETAVHRGNPQVSCGGLSCWGQRDWRNPLRWRVLFFCSLHPLPADWRRKGECYSVITGVCKSPSWESGVQMVTWFMIMEWTSDN